MSTRTAPISIGDLDVIATYEVHGNHARATPIDPEEWPEIELRRLVTAGGEDISGLLEFPPVYEHALMQIDEQERETNYGRDPDPDEAYDRARDARWETV